MNKMYNTTKIVALLQDNEVVIVPTDTLYGIATLLNEENIEKIYAIKKRSLKPIAVLCANLEQIESIAFLNEIDQKLIKEFMPGALTLILKQKEGLPKNLNLLSNTVGVRIPENQELISVLLKTGPLAVSSANLSGEGDVLEIDEIYQIFKPFVSGFLSGKIIKGYGSLVVDSTKNYEVLRSSPLFEKFNEWKKNNVF